MVIYCISSKLMLFARSRNVLASISSQISAPSAGFVRLAQILGTLLEYYIPITITAFLGSEDMQPGRNLLTFRKKPLP
jgi:hypothetical protein